MLWSRFLQTISRRCLPSRFALWESPMTPVAALRWFLIDHWWLRLHRSHFHKWQHDMIIHQSCVRRLQKMYFKATKMLIFTFIQDGISYVCLLQLPGESYQLFFQLPLLENWLGSSFGFQYLPATEEHQFYAGLNSPEVPSCQNLWSSLCFPYPLLDLPNSYAGANNIKRA